MWLKVRVCDCPGCNTLIEYSFYWMQLSCVNSLVGLTDRERGHISCGTFESQSPLEADLLFSNGLREEWYSVFAYSVLRRELFYFPTTMTHDNFEQAWRDIRLTRVRWMKIKFSRGHNSRSNRKATLSCRNPGQGKLKMDDEGAGWCLLFTLEGDCCSKHCLGNVYLSVSVDTGWSNMKG